MKKKIFALTLAVMMGLTSLTAFATESNTGATEGIQADADFYAKAPDDEHANFNFPPEELAELIEAGEVPYTIVSVRKPEDFEQGHIQGAVNIPYGPGMQDQLKDLPKDKPVIVYCYTGQSGSQTMTVLRLMGYEAYNLNGGMGSAETESGWLGAGLPVVTE